MGASPPTHLPPIGVFAPLVTMALGASLLMSARPPSPSSGPPTPPDSPLSMQDVISSALYRDLMTPKLREGDPAFAFTLPQLDLRGGEPRSTGRTVSLSSFRGRKPVALIFGSYT